MRSTRRSTVLLAAVAMLAAACAGGEDGGGSSADALVMKDNVFEPESWTISGAGTYTLDNQGQALHNLTIEESDVDVDVQPGQSQDVEIDLDPGQYKMVCEYHVAQRMAGVLTVE